MTFIFLALLVGMVLGALAQHMFGSTILDELKDHVEDLVQNAEVGIRQDIAGVKADIAGTAKKL